MGHVRRGLAATLGVGAFVALSSRTVAAQNFAPIASASATSTQAFVGDAVQFSSSASIDPDSSPQPLTFLWEFDDGTTSTAANPAHVFSAARAHTVRLTVDDGADTAIDVMNVYILDRPLLERARHSSALALSADGTRLWVANPDSNSISLLSVSPTGLELVEERAICRRPRTLSFAEDANRIYVACEGERAVAALDLASGEVTRIAVGAEPYGVVALASGRVLVSNQGDDTVTLIGADLTVLQTWGAGIGPRAIAVSADGSRAFVTCFRSFAQTGTVIIHDLDARAAIGTITLQQDPGPDTASSGRGAPNLMSAATIDPAGRQLWIGGLKANTSVGQFRTGGTIAPVNWLRGLAAPVTLSTGADNMARRIDTNDADSVSAIEISADGRYGYLSHQGAGTVSIYDLSKATLFAPGAGTSVPFDARVDTGDAPQAIAIAPDGKTIYVSNYLSRDVVAIDVSQPATSRIAARMTVTAEPLAPDIANGKRLFYRSREPFHSKSNYVACASCHADGGMHDGQTWDFTQGGEGLRNTTDLRGRAGMGHGRVHWSANFDEIQDFETPIITLFGGTGLAQDGAPPNPPLGAPNAGRSQDLDDLAAYVTSLAYTPRSPVRNLDGSLSEAATRGEALFRDPALRCMECHAPPAFTNSSLDDVPLIDTGTLAPGSGNRLGAPLAGIDVPSLIGAWAGAPYFHDGSAPTLRDVFRGRLAVLEAQLTASLSDAELDDLMAFVRSIDAPEPDPQPQPDPVQLPAGCGCQGADPASSVLVTLLLLPLVRRRRGTTGEPT